MKKTYNIVYTLYAKNLMEELQCTNHYSSSGCIFKLQIAIGELKKDHLKITNCFACEHSNISCVLIFRREVFEGVLLEYK